MSAQPVIPAGELFAAVPGYVPRPAVVSEFAEHAWQRRFNTPNHRAVNTSLDLYADFGASVFRDAREGIAELRVEARSNGSFFDVALDLKPVALVELALRLLDAAHDIVSNPAGSLE